jgi:hypothetical protein
VRKAVVQRVHPEHHGVVEQRSVPLWHGFQLVEELREQRQVPNLDSDLVRVVLAGTVTDVVMVALGKLDTLLRDPKPGKEHIVSVTVAQGKGHRAR